ncbi:MAG: hypothetical protein U5J63_15995 [Fodinibius sp.]|nr:hypothetical protein [Fodinibius sp.]
MLSHFRVWKREGEDGASTSESFQMFMEQMFTEQSMRSLQDDGLFAWSFFLMIPISTAEDPPCRLLSKP